LEKKPVKVEKKEVKATIEDVVAKYVKSELEKQCATLTSRIVLLQIERDGLKQQIQKFKTQHTPKPIV